MALSEAQQVCVGQKHDFQVLVLGSDDRIFQHRPRTLDQHHKVMCPFTVRQQGNEHDQCTHKLPSKWIIFHHTSCRFVKKSGCVAISQCHKIYAQFLPTFACMLFSKNNCGASDDELEENNYISFQRKIQIFH